MVKTFWSVKYAVIGSGCVFNAWFDNKAVALAFAAHDFRDDPVRHTYSDPRKIAEAEQLVREEAISWW